MEKTKAHITVGNGENHAGVFNYDRKTITLAVVLRGHSDQKKERLSDMFERLTLMTGCNYEKTLTNNDEIYTIEVFKIKQLERLAPMIAKGYSNYKTDVTVSIDKGCYEFLNEQKDTPENK